MPTASMGASSGGGGHEIEIGQGIGELGRGRATYRWT
jgi:hypothetical protein